MIYIDIEDEPPLLALQSVLRGGPVHPDRNFPNKISEKAMRLFESTLAKGSVQFLVQGGAWKKRPSLVCSEPARVWDKYPDLKLEFESSYAFLRAYSSTGAACFPRFNGDELFLAFLLSSPSQNKPEHDSALGCLIDPLGSEQAIKRGPNWEVLVTENAWAIEGLFDRLRDAWVSVERAKMDSPPQRAAEIGSVQDRILNGFLAAVDQAKRRDLASFLVEAGQVFLRSYPTRKPIEWGATALSARQGMQKSIGSFFRQLGKIGEWAREAGLVAYYESHYQESQILLSCWSSAIREGFFDASSEMAKSFEEVF